MVHPEAVKDIFQSAIPNVALGVGSARMRRICIHREIVYDPNTRQKKQTGKCQTDGLRVGTYSIGCTHVCGDLAWEKAD